MVYCYDTRLPKPRLTPDGHPTSRPASPAKPHRAAAAPGGDAGDGAAAAAGGRAAAANGLSNRKASR